jgi:hypothetical protein
MKKLLHIVIASIAKQSSALRFYSVDCRVAVLLAMTVGRVQ